MSTRSQPPSTETTFMAANESFYNSFCLKSVSHGALECDSPRRWNIIRGSKKKEVDPPFSLCVGRFALLQLRNSLCAQIEKNPYLNPTICNGPKLYMKSKFQEIILGFQKVFSSLKLLNTENFWKFYWHQNWNATPQRPLFIGSCKSENMCENALIRVNSLLKQINGS